MSDLQCFHGTPAATCPHQLCRRTDQEIEKLKLQVGELRKFVERYGQHDRECSNNHPSPCSCGYDERLAKLEDAETPFTDAELKALRDSPFKGPDDAYPEKRVCRCGAEHTGPCLPGAIS